VKFLLIPLGIAVFILFILILGAIGLLIAMTVLSLLGRLWRRLAGGSRRHRD
jgi:hypothetical protein